MNHLKRMAMLAVALVACASASAAFADYPVKPVKIVVPYPPGGTSDILARFIAAQLGTRLRQPFVVENRAGASGAIGSQAVAAAPDGYTPEEFARQISAEVAKWKNVAATNGLKAE